MSAMKTQRFNHKPTGAADVNETPTSVIPAAYALAKAKSEQEVIAIMHDISSAIYPALARHICARPNLFLPEVRATVARIIDTPKMSEAEALFA